MFCSSASLFNCFFTWWERFSIELMSGLLDGIENIRAPISNIIFFTFKEFWLGSPSCRNNCSRGLLLFSKAFSKCYLTKFAKKLSCQLLFILLTQNCSVTMGNGYKHFLHFTPRALFFSFGSAFQCQTLWLFTPYHCSSWSGLVTWISFMSPWGSIKIETNSISPPKVHWRNTFYFTRKKQSCSGIMPCYQTFLWWF